MYNTKQGLNKYESLFNFFKPEKNAVLKVKKKYKENQHIKKREKAVLRILDLKKPLLSSGLYLSLIWNHFSVPFHYLKNGL